MDENKKNALVAKILSSKKYKDYPEKTVRRIVEDMYFKYSEKKLEKQVKNKLHQISGSFNESQKIFKHLDIDGDLSSDLIRSVLETHSSTRERMPFLEEFYKDIFKVTGDVESLLDIGCGLNPLAFLVVPSSIATYTGVEINGALVKINNLVLQKAQVKTKFNILHNDVFDSSILKPRYDLVLLFKMMQVLDLMENNGGENVIGSLDSRYFVLSFPILSLSGKQVGMKNFYQNYLEKLCKKQNLKTIFYKAYKNEVLYVLERG